MNDIENRNRFDINAISKPLNNNISVVDIAFRNQGKFVEVFIGTRHYQGKIVSIDDYFNLCLDDGVKLHFFKANKVNEIVIYKEG